jgi:serine/threonine protein kinase
MALSTASRSSLERTVALLRSQHEAAIDGILVIDENRKVVSYNKRFLEVWRIDPALAKEADDHTLLGAVIEQLADPKEFLERVEYLYEHRDEQSRDQIVLRDGRALDRYSSPVVSEEGEHFGRVWFFRDVTAERNAEQLGQYVLEEKIGEGGMGIVYRARHVLLRRPTAVKLLHPDRTDETALRRFEREVQITSQLTHPNTIVVFDYGRSSSGAFYYAMEFLDGINLAQLVDGYGPQPAGRVVRILEQAAGALAEAHAKGLIHRDIKPANFMLMERVQAPDFVKVLDFGLVKSIDSKGSIDHRALDGTISGTPRFMAPEAITEPDKVDARSDIYALGALAYFLLTGSPVFEAKALIALLAEVVGTAPVRPSERLGKPLPAELEDLVMRCLAKSPKDRPASAIELRKALLACKCREEFDDERASQWWTAHRERPKTQRSMQPVHNPTVSETVVGIDFRVRREA